MLSVMKMVYDQETIWVHIGIKEFQCSWVQVITPPTPHGVRAHYQVHFLQLIADCSIVCPRQIQTRLAMMHMWPLDKYVPLHINSKRETNSQEKEIIGLSLREIEIEFPLHQDMYDKLRQVIMTQLFVYRGVQIIALGHAIRVLGVFKILSHGISRVCH